VKSYYGVFAWIDGDASITIAIHIDTVAFGKNIIFVKIFLVAFFVK